MREHKMWDDVSRSGPGDHGGHSGAGKQLNFTGSTYAGGSHSHVGHGRFDYRGTDAGSGATGGGARQRGDDDREQRGARGPKGYVRSDERILDDLVEQLAADDAVDVTEVSVQVQGGNVTLAGTVPVRSMKHHIEELVAGCNGVGTIDNRIRVSGKNGATSV